MQTVNLYYQPRIDPWTLTPSRIVLATGVLAAVLLIIAVLINSRAGNMNDDYVQRVAERDELRSNLESLQARPLPVADPALQKQIAALQRFRTRLLAVHETLSLHSAVTTKHLVRILDAVENADLGPVWLESIELRADSGIGNRFIGRSTTSDAIAEYVKRLEAGLLPMNWSIEQISVSNSGDGPLRFELVTSELESES